jgi:hypothetical protein
LIHKLVTGAIADTAIIVISAAIVSGVATAITAIVATITAITSAVSRAITATVAAAVTTTVAAAVTTSITTSITAAIDTARRPRRRRRRRSIDLATRRWSNLAARPRRRSIDLATRRRWRRSIGDGTRGNDRSTGDGEVGCFGLGRNGGGSECERCRGHDGYPA